ncbi:MAG TPA: hypothetical protein VFO70_08285, partial [Chitinophagaceae bacterium]|nr:hypothetical protein [Chitinophagaceae bacterium]
SSSKLAFTNLPVSSSMAICPDINTKSFARVVLLNGSGVVIFSEDCAIEIIELNSKKISQFFFIEKFRGTAN